jgi:hypothetical protein
VYTEDGVVHEVVPLKSSVAPHVVCAEAVYGKVIGEPTAPAHVLFPWENVLKDRATNKITAETGRKKMRLFFFI